MGARTSSLPSLTGGITSVAFGLASGLILNNPRYPGILCRLSRLDLCRSCCGDGRLFSSRKGHDPGELLMFQPIPFRTARLARFNKRDALGLSGGL